MDGHRIGLYRAQGIVLRGTRLGEADRIITVYTQAHGRVRGVAKGIRKSKSRFGGRLDAFTHVDLQLYRGRSDLDIVAQAEIIARPRRIREDYAAFCAASAMAEAIERTTPEREPNVRLFLLLRTGLEALEGIGDDDRAGDVAAASMLAFAFLAKLGSMAGLHPRLEACVDCGRAVAEVASLGFSHARGGVVCAGCVDASDQRASPEALQGWSAFLGEGWDELRSRRLAPDAQRELGVLLLGFVQWHTESRLRAFGLLPAAAGP